MSVGVSKAPGAVSAPHEGPRENPAIAEELPTVNQLLESQFSRRTWFLVGEPHSGGGYFHTHAYMGCTNWTQWVIKEKEKDKKLVGGCGEG